MIEWISTWAEQIIVAVIIGTIIEMILPNGKNKKYIKTIIGIYILFTIISPITSKVTNSDLSDIDFNYEKYFENTNTYQTMAQSLSTTNDKSTIEIYTNSLKEDMKSKIQEKGYKITSIDITVNTNDEDYGKIQQVSMIIEEKETDDKQTNTNKIVINEVNIGTKTEKESTEKSEIEDSKIQEIKEYISSVYEVKFENIQIN